MRTGENIYKRKDGRWEARVPIGRLPNNRLKYKCLYAGTYKAVLAKKKEYEKNFAVNDSANYNSQKIRFYEAAEIWFEFSKTRWHPSTFSKYQEHWNRYLSPYWGEKTVCSCTQQEYDEFLMLYGTDYGDSLLNMINTILAGILKLMIRKGYLKSFPFVLENRRHSKASCRTRVLTEEELTMISEYAVHTNKSTYLSVIISAYAGLRIGEICALKWEDVDINHRIIHVRHTLQRITNPEKKEQAPKTVLHLGVPKNGKEREIPIHPGICSILKEYKKGFPETYYVLGNMHPMEPRTLSNHFKKLLHTADINDVTFHTLRHTFATNCVEAGMNIKVLSEILGHSSIKITMDRYVHLSKDYKQEQIRILRFPLSCDNNRQSASQIS